MATIKINRKNEFNNKYSVFKIFINNIQVGTIANGETKTFNIAAGNQKVVAKIGWCSSNINAFNLQQHETKNFILSGFKHSHWFMPIVGGIIALHFILKFFLICNIF